MKFWPYLGGEWSFPEDINDITKAQRYPITKVFKIFKWIITCYRIIPSNLLNLVSHLRFFLLFFLQAIEFIKQMCPTLVLSHLFCNKVL